MAFLKWLLLLFIFLSVSCISQNRNTYEISEHAPVTPNQIITLVFKISEGELVLDTFMLAKGILKRDKIEEIIPVENDLFFQFYSNDGKVCKSFFIKNPLQKIVEYSSNYRELNSELISLTEACFSFRLQHSGCFQNLRVEKITKPTKLNLILYDQPLTVNENE